jgi:hypothetical protein
MTTIPTAHFAELASSSLQDIAQIQGLVLVLAAMLHDHPAHQAIQDIGFKLEVLHNDIDVAFELAGV